MLHAPAMFMLPLKLRRQERFTRMELLEMTTPADFETLRQQKGASLIFTTLEILDDVERSPDSLLVRCARLGRDAEIAACPNSLTAC